jgi:hypothetical protein
MATCPHCENEIDDGARFCGVCGRPITQTAEAAARAATSASSDVSGSHHAPPPSTVPTQVPVTPSTPASGPAPAPLHSAPNVMTMNRSGPGPRLAPAARPAPAPAPAVAPPAPIRGPAQPLENLIGRTLNHRYIVEDKIGEGGFGAVFRGKQIWQVARRLHVTCAEAQAAFEAALPYLRQALGAGGSDKVTRGHRDEVKRTYAVAAARTNLTRSRGRVGRSGLKGRATAAKTCGKARAAELVPSHLRREKAFRRWVVLNVPWAYRRFVAYHHLRGLAVERVAEKLGVPAAKAWDMERVSKGLISRAIEAYSETLAVAA